MPVRVVGDHEIDVADKVQSFVNFPFEVNCPGGISGLSYLSAATWRSSPMFAHC